MEELGDLLTAEEYQGLLDEQARMDALGITAGMTELQKLRATVPWLNAVWGRLDGKSLRETWPQAYKEIIRNYGLGLFRSAEKGGLAVDLLADELVRDNVFQQDMGADELVERLKMPRQGLRLFQSGPEALGAVSEQLASVLPFGKKGRITLDAASFEHIEKNHGEEIRNAGFVDVFEFINHVLSHVDAVYPGRTKRSFDFVNKEGKPFGRVLGRLEFIGSSTFSVELAFGAKQ